MKVIIEKVFRDDYKEGQFGISRKVAIKIKNGAITTVNGEKGDATDKWIYTFQKQGQNKELDSWQSGMEVDVDITKKGDFFNFKIAGTGNGSSVNLVPIIERLEKLEDAVFAKAKKATKKVVEDDDVDIDFD